jgi:hypothetical protein
MNNDSTKTQRERILSLLINANGGEVPSYEMAKIALQYGTRVKELRAEGHKIVNRVKVVNGQRHGSFHLVTEPAAPILTRATPVQPGRVLSLFSESSPVRYIAGGQ